MAIFQDETSTSRRLTKKDNRDLRQEFDGDEPIMSRGMGVVAPREIRTVVRCDSQDPHDAFWFNNDGAVRNVLMQRFPLFKADPDQQRNAARWYEVLIRYFRLGHSASRIQLDLQDEFGWVLSVECIVQQIRRCRQGLRPNGRPYSNRKRGRPRKMSLTPVPLMTGRPCRDANPQELSTSPFDPQS